MVDTTLGLVAVHLISTGVTSGVLVVVVGTLVGMGYTVYGRLQGRHTSLAQLYRFGQALAGLVNADEVIRAVLVEARNLLNAEVAQLVWHSPRGLVYHSLSAGDELPRLCDDGDHALVAAAEGRPGGLLATRAADDKGLKRALSSCGFRDAVIVRLPADEAVGASFLVIANRLGDHVTFGTADLTLADALAAHAAMALRSSNLLDRLRQEVTVKEHQASHDALTGLANRTLFSATLDQALSERAEDSMIGVMLMDLDGFKELNDTLGHEAGDALLVQLAHRLREVIGPGGQVARLGGDEFAMLVCGARSEAAVLAVADQLSGAVEAPVVIGGKAVEIRASIGVTLAPNHGKDRSTLLRLADITMYRAKERGGGVAVHDARRNDDRVRAPSLIAPLREAIGTSALELHYQPKADVRTGRVVGAEALLRWTDPVYGSISPDQFIPVAERSGLIRPLTYWVLDTALSQLAAWQQQGVDWLNLAVNLSSFTLSDPGIVDQVRRVLAAHRISPDALTLEITESAVGGDQRENQQVLSQLACLGVRLSIDDYGIGSSSLARVMNLPLKEIKIDKSFVTNMATDETAAIIVESTIALARRLGITVVAEGVETEDTWRRLGRMGCDTAQGFHLSRPLPAADFNNWLQTADAHRGVKANAAVPLRITPT